VNRNGVSLAGPLELEDCWPSRLWAFADARLLRLGNRGELAGVSYSAHATSLHHCKDYVCAACGTPLPKIVVHSPHNDSATHDIQQMVLNFRP
jgi:hypothetical protein